MRQLHWSLALLGLTLSGCAPTSRAVMDQVPTRSQQEQEAEYSVYSHLLRGSKEPIIVSDSTLPPFQGRAAFCFQPDSEAGSCITPASATEAWQDFAAKNRVAWQVLPLFDKTLNVILRRDATLPEATCSGPTIVYFSRVGLNHDLTQAVVFITSVTGKGPMPGCGFATGSHLVLERTPSGWKEVGEQIKWVT